MSSAAAVAEVISLPGTNTPEAVEGFWAYTTLEDIPTDTAQGASASLIYVEGDLALYLDEDDVAGALQEVSDRDLVLMRSLVTLAAERLHTEHTRRARAAYPQPRISGGLLASNL